MNENKARRAYAKAVKMRFEDELRGAAEKERPFTKAYLAQRLHDEARFDLALCNQTLDALCTALFNETPPQVEQELAGEPLPQKPRRAQGKKIVLPLIIIAALLGAAAFYVYVSRSSGNL